MNQLEYILTEWRRVPGSIKGGLRDVSLSFFGRDYVCRLMFEDGTSIPFEGRTLAGAIEWAYDWMQDACEGKANGT
jgi:hypothetical protein